MAERKKNAAAVALGRLGGLKGGKAWPRKVTAEPHALSSPESDFGINVERVPFFFVEVHLHTGDIYQVRGLAGESG